MTDKTFPVRTGVPQGASVENRMLAKVDPSEFRTVIKDNPDGSTTMLKTKGGFPEFVTKSPEKPIKVSVNCFPMTEKTLAGGETQADRLYYHDNETDGAVPEKRKFSCDGLFSYAVTPLKRLRLQTSLGAKYLTAWFADHSTPDEPVNPGAGVSTEFNAAGQTLKAVEIGRKYHAARTAKTTFDAGNEFALVMKRISEITFSLTGFVDVTKARVRLASTDATGVNVAAGTGVEVFAERDIFEREHYLIATMPNAGPQILSLKKLFVGSSSHSVTLAQQGGLLTPFPFLRDNGVLYDHLAPFKDLCDLDTFGQPWHGFFVYERVNGVVTPTLWASPEKTENKNTQIEAHASGPVGFHDTYAMIGDPVRYYDFGGDEPTTPPDLLARGGLFTRDFFTCGQALGPTPDGTLFSTRYANEHLYKDPEGAVWMIGIEEGLADGSFYNQRVILKRRVDNLGSSVEYVNRVLASVTLNGVYANQPTPWQTSHNPNGSEVVMVLGVPQILQEMQDVRSVGAVTHFKFSGSGASGVSCEISPLSVIQQQAIKNAPVNGYRDLSDYEISHPNLGLIHSRFIQIKPIPSDVAHTEKMASLFESGGRGYGGVTKSLISYSWADGEFKPTYVEISSKAEMVAVGTCQAKRTSTNTITGEVLFEIGHSFYTSASSRRHGFKFSITFDGVTLYSYLPDVDYRVRGDWPCTDTQYPDSHYSWIIIDAHIGGGFYALNNTPGRNNFGLLDNDDFGTYRYSDLIGYGNLGTLPVAVGIRNQGQYGPGDGKCGHFISARWGEGVLDISRSPLVIAGVVDDKPFNPAVPDPWIFNPKTRTIHHIDPECPAHIY